jgi:hypothetical protein
LFAIDAHKNWKVFQLDVKLAFLNGVLHGEIYVEQPAMFVIQEKEENVYFLEHGIAKLMII